MTILSYSRGRLQIGMLLFALGAFGLLIKLTLIGYVAGVVGANAILDFRMNVWLPLCLAVTGTVIWRLWVLSAGDKAAIRMEPGGIVVTGLFRRRTIAWDALLAAHIVGYGLGLYRQRWLNLRYLDDGATRAVRVPLVVTRQPSGGYNALAAKLEQSQAEALGRPCAPGGERIGGSGLDPDAVIARYLAAKAQQAAAPQPATLPATAQEPIEPRAPARPAFGRKGLS